MKPKNVVFILCLTIVVFALIISRLRHEPHQKELFERRPAHLRYTEHSLCRMRCQRITKEDIGEIMQRGIINLNRSDRYAAPCPVYTLQGNTEAGKEVRVVFSQCAQETLVLTCFNMKQDITCSCPDDELKKYD